MCVDYRLVNERIYGDQYPLPLINELFNKARRGLIFSKIDLASGFYQIPVKKECRGILAFSDGSELYTFTVLPFGLKISPAAFCRILNAALRPCWAFTATFMDDILVFSDSVDEHAQHLLQVLRCLGATNFKIALKKTTLGAHSVQYLGHILSKNELRTDPAKVAAILQWPLPSTVRQLRRFLGTVHYYRGFIPECARLAAPLYDLATGKGAIQLGDKEVQAFQALQSKLVSPKVLINFESTRETQVHVDASSLGAGAVLLQFEGSDWRPAEYYSKKYNQVQKLLPARDLELLAMYLAITHWRPFLQGLSFVVVTDHSSLTLRQSAKLSARASRWWIALSEYRFQVVYRKGAKHVVPDALSRLGEGDEEADDAIPAFPFTEEKAEDAESTLGAETQPSDLPYMLPAEDDWKRALVTCPFAGPIVKILQGDLAAPWAARAFARRAVDKEKLLLRQGILVTEDGRRVVPEAYRALLVKLYHNTPFSAHLGTRKVASLLGDCFWWPNLTADVNFAISSCMECKVVKGAVDPRRGGLVVPRISPAPWTYIAVDFAGPLPKSQRGNIYVLIVLDAFTGFPEAFPTRTTSALETATILYNQIFCRYGVPMVITSDNGGAFRSTLMDRLSKLMGVRLSFTSPRHPASNGLAERLVKTIKQMLKTTAAGMKSWEDYLGSALLALRRSPRAPTWLSPAQLLFGWNLRGPIEAQLPTEPSYTPEDQWADERLRTYREVRLELEQKLTVEKETRAATVNSKKPEYCIAPGALVLTFNSKTLLEDARRVRLLWEGPFVVLKQTGATNYQVLYKGAPKVFHVSRLLAFSPEGSEDESTLQLATRLRGEYRKYLQQQLTLTEAPAEGSDAKSENPTLPSVYPDTALRLPPPTLAPYLMDPLSGATLPDHPAIDPDGSELPLVPQVPSRPLVTSVAAMPNRIDQGSEDKYPVRARHRASLERTASIPAIESREGSPPFERKHKERRAPAPISPARGSPSVTRTPDRSLVPDRTSSTSQQLPTSDGATTGSSDIAAASLSRLGSRRRSPERKRSLDPHRVELTRARESSIAPLPTSKPPARSRAPSILRPKPSPLPTRALPADVPTRPQKLRKVASPAELPSVAPSPLAPISSPVESLSAARVPRRAPSSMAPTPSTVEPLSVATPARLMPSPSSSSVRRDSPLEPSVARPLRPVPAPLPRIARLTAGKMALMRTDEGVVVVKILHKGAGQRFYHRRANGAMQPLYIDKQGGLTWSQLHTWPLVLDLRDVLVTDFDLCRSRLPAEVLALVTAEGWAPAPVLGFEVAP